jgi:hypothetical protein
MCKGLFSAMEDSSSENPTVREERRRTAILTAADRTRTALGCDGSSGRVGVKLDAMEFLASLKSLSGAVFLLGVAIALVSLVSAVIVKTGRDRNLAIVVGLLALALVLVQYFSNERTRAVAKVEAKRSHEELIAASRGSKMPPSVMVDSRANERPERISVYNPDKEANVYDLVLRVSEAEFAANGSFRSLQQKTFTFPMIPPGHGSPSQPFDLLSKTGTSYIQYELSTRRQDWSGLIVVRSDGNGRWTSHLFPVHEGGLTFHRSEILDMERH